MFKCKNSHRMSIPHAGESCAGKTHSDNLIKRINKRSILLSILVMAIMMSLTCVLAFADDGVDAEAVEIVNETVEEIVVQAPEPEPEPIPEPEPVVVPEPEPEPEPEPVVEIAPPPEPQEVYTEPPVIEISEPVQEIIFDDGGSEEEHVDAGSEIVIPDSEITFDETDGSEESHEALPDDVEKEINLSDNTDEETQKDEEKTEEITPDDKPSEDIVLPDEGTPSQGSDEGQSNGEQSDEETVHPVSGEDPLNPDITFPDYPIGPGIEPIESGDEKPSNTDEEKHEGTGEPADNPEIPVIDIPDFPVGPVIEPVNQNDEKQEEKGEQDEKTDEPELPDINVPDYPGFPVIGPKDTNVKEEQTSVVDAKSDEEIIIDLTSAESIDRVVPEVTDEVIVIDITAIEDSKIKKRKTEKETSITDSDTITVTPSGITYGASYPTGTTYYNTNSYYPTWQVSRDTWLTTLTPYERLLTDMTATAERQPGVAANQLNIYESANPSSRIVGTLPKNGICYILQEGDWVYIESGEVRGFVRKTDILSGADAENIMRLYGRSSMQKASATILPEENAAFKYMTLTTADIPEMPSIVSGYGASRFGNTTINRQDIVRYAEQFIGRPYVWGGEDLMNGTDCSGFTQGVYAHFGLQIPRTSSEQSYAGERIDVRSAKPGDLVFYAQDGQVVHVMLYIGNGQVVHAESSDTGIVISNLDYGRVCWACRMIPEGVSTSTQASDLVVQGRLASEGDENARQAIIDALATASENEWDTYGFPRSVLIAQTIQESNWISFEDESVGGIAPQDNNILGMNEELLNDEWESPWTGDAAQRNVPQIEDGELIYGEELMRTYEDIEACMNDYAAFKIGLHPELQGETDIDIVIEEGLQGYATDPDYQSSIKHIIDEYDLTKYDEKSASTGIINSVDYTQQQLELIWAITGQEDDTSYEGALAVITTAMNRADQNYGGYGTDALSQLTADGQFCYSPSVSDPIYYQRRLNGNVPEYVKQAVADCLGRGVRNHTYTNFRSSNRTGNYVKIGSNWYF